MPSLRRSRRKRRSQLQPVPAGRRRRCRASRCVARQTGDSAQFRQWRRTATSVGGYRRTGLHRLHVVHASLSGRCNSWRTETDAHRASPNSAPAAICACRPARSTVFRCRSVTGDATGWDAWSQSQADAARARHNRREARLAREREAAEARAAARRAGASAGAPALSRARRKPPKPRQPPSHPPLAPATDDAEAKKRAIIQAALERARKKKEELAAKGQGPRNTEQVSADVQAQIDAAEARRRRLGLTAEGNGDADKPSNPR